MIRVIAAAGLALLGLWSSALAQEPQVSFELDSTEATVGQPLVLRIKVLVPTWMPKPPEFPDIELPSLMVRLPERASGPISERVDGETWSGIQRAYRLYPLAAGSFTLPPGKISITYAEPGQTDAIAYSAALPDISFRATVPDAAKDLTPLVIAQSFAVEQSLEGNPDLVVGGAISRTIIASITGTTPVMIPQLNQASETLVIRAYPKEPVVTESESRGVLSGKRTETITYIGQQAGTITLPPLAIDWFNLDTGKVETAQLSGVDLTITGGANPIQTPGPRDLAVWGTLAVGLGMIFWGLIRLAGPRLRVLGASILTSWRRSEYAACRRVRAAIRNRNLSDTMVALSDWSDHFPDADQTDFSELRRALADIGAAQFGNIPGSTDAGWTETRRSFIALRSELRRNSSMRSRQRALPDLNPWK